MRDFCSVKKKKSYLSELIRAFIGLNFFFRVLCSLKDVKHFAVHVHVTSNNQYLSCVMKSPKSQI